MASLESGMRTEWQRFVGELIERTQKKLLVWRGAGREDLPEVGDDERIGSCYIATLNERLVRVYDSRKEAGGSPGIYNIYDSIVEGNLPARSRRPWTRSIHLEITTEDGRNWWGFPSMSISSDLFDAVARQSANVEEFVRGVLSEAPSASGLTSPGPNDHND